MANEPTQTNKEKIEALKTWLKVSKLIFRYRETREHIEALQAYKWLGKRGKKDRGTNKQE